MGQGVVTTPTLRRRIFSLPAHLTRSGRIATLRLPKAWPWAETIALAFTWLRSLPHPRLTGAAAPKCCSQPGVSIPGIAAVGFGEQLLGQLTYGGSRKPSIDRGDHAGMVSAARI